MACLLGVQQSFAKAEVALREVAGWKLDDNTLRRLVHATARQAHATRATRDTAATFAAAEGDHELHLDAGKANTVETGWRDVKVAVFARRKRGQPCTAATWSERDLPAPGVRTVLAAVTEAADFGTACAAEAKRLGWTEATPLSTLGDGAEWVWNQVEEHFWWSDRVLDFWHGVEYLGAGAREALGADHPEVTAVVGRGKGQLLAAGYEGVVTWVGEVNARMPSGGSGAGLAKALNYFAGQKPRLGYAARLARGQAIGSGLVEGTIKQHLNRRLKQTGAKWRTAHVAPLVELGALAAGKEWQAFWETS
jgi:hypothetical protein